MIHPDFKFLGRKVEDKITGFIGVGISLSFDLFGCIQILVRSVADSSGKVSDESYWMDTKRLKIVDPEPVMELPNFVHEPIGCEFGKPIL